MREIVFGKTNKTTEKRRLKSGLRPCLNTFPYQAHTAALPALGCKNRCNCNY